MKKKLLVFGIAIISLLISGCNKGSHPKTEEVEKTNFESVEQFNVTNDSVNELEVKLNNVGLATVNSMDNVGMKSKVENTYVDVKQTEETQKEENSEMVNETNVTSFSLKNLNFNFEAGTSGIYSAKEANEFKGYARLNDVTGSLSFGVNKNGSNKKVAYNLKDNSLEFYQHDGKEYLGLSKEFVNTIFGVIEVATYGDVEPGSIAATKLLVPSSGKMCFTGLFDENTEYPLANKTEKMEDFLDDLPELLTTLQNECNKRGYLLEELITFKVASSEQHYLSLYLSIDSNQLLKIKELSKDIDEESIELPFDIDPNTTTLDKVEFTLESDIDMRVIYANVNMENVNVNQESYNEYDKTNSTLIVKDTNVHLTTELDYGVKVDDHMPSDTELAVFENNTYDLKEILNALLSTKGAN